jgi:biopolymer transport protein ExbD
MLPNLLITQYVGLLVLLGTFRLACDRIRDVASPQHLFGVQVYVSRACNPTDTADDRTIVLDILASGEARINSSKFTEAQIPLLMSQIMEHRYERVLRVSADDGVEYGRVVNLIGNVKAAVPRLAVVLLPRGEPEFVSDNWCISSSDIVPSDR